MGTFILDTLFEVCLKVVMEEKLSVKTKKGPKFVIIFVITGLTVGELISGHEGAVILCAIGLLAGWIYGMTSIFYNQEDLHRYMQNKITPAEKKMLIERVKKSLEYNLKGDISVIIPVIANKLSEREKRIIIEAIHNFMVNKNSVVGIISRKTSYISV